MFTQGADANFIPMTELPVLQAINIINPNKQSRIFRGSLSKAEILEQQIKNLYFNCSSSKLIKAKRRVVLPSILIEGLKMRLLEVDSVLLDSDEVSRLVNVDGLGNVLVAIKRQTTNNLTFFKSLFIGDNRSNFIYEREQRAGDSCRTIIQRILGGKEVDPVNVVIFLQSIRERKISMAK